LKNEQKTKNKKQKRTKKTKKNKLFISVSSFIGELPYNYSILKFGRLIFNKPEKNGKCIQILKCCFSNSSLVN